jgi:hypothetical protein
MRYLILSLLAMLPLASACSAKRQTRAEQPRTVLEVDNQGFSDVNIYVVSNGFQQRMGFAPGHTKTLLTIPPSAITGARMLRFLADPIGSRRTALSQEIYVSPGDQVTLVIPPT